MSDLPPGFTIVQPPGDAAGALPPGFTPVAETPKLREMLAIEKLADAKPTLNLGGFTEAARNAATFGLSDPFAAAGRAAIQPLWGDNAGGFSDRYFRNLKQQREPQEQFAKENPGQNLAATLLGYATPMAPALGAAGAAVNAARPTLARMMGEGSIVGAGIGGATGLSESPARDAGGLLRDAGIGAGVGVGVGAGIPAAASFLAPVGQAIARRFSPSAVENQGVSLLGGRIAQDAAAGGPSTAELATRLGANPNLSLMDVGGENTQALAGRMARTQGEPRELVTRFLNDRDAEAGNRLTSAVDARIASGGPTFTTEQAMMRQRAQDTKPLWDQFYAAPSLNPDTIAAGGELDRMMTRPAMVKASNNALNLAKEEGRDPASLGITFNAAGDPVFERVPSWQTLDYVKRGLDDVLNAHRDSTTGRLVRDEGVNAIEGTMRAFRDFIDANNPAYAPARAAWSGPSQSIAAMKMGGGFANMAPDRIAYEIGRLDPGDRDFYRLGAANALKSQIAGKGPGGNEALALMGNKTKQDQLAAIFPDQASFQRFMQEVANPEAQMFQTRMNVIGGSPTGRRVAEDAGGGGGWIDAITGPLSVAFGTSNPYAMLGMVPRLARAVNQMGETTNPAVSAQAARLMTSTDPATLAQVLARITNHPRPVSPALAAPLSGLGASVYPNIEMSPQRR